MSDANGVLWRRLGYMLSPQLDIYRHIAEHVAGCSVLDVGFGTGFGALLLTETAKDVTGVEIDTDAVKFASDCIPGIDFSFGDISRGVQFLAKQFDVVTMIEVLEHIENWEASLANIYRVLKSGGEFYISARNANADLRKNDLHEREWTARQLTEALNKYFNEVTLYDYSLTHMLDTETRQTPLVAVARKD